MTSTTPLGMHDASWKEQRVPHPLDWSAHPQLREAVVFVLIWAAILLLAIAVEIGGLYFLDALR